MARIVYGGRIDGDFHGFDEEALFKMRNGTFWIQAQYKYWYHHADSPAAMITEESGRHTLIVAGESIPVRRVSNVVESRIDGEFRGWEGDTEYTLQNGQVWRQSTYQYTNRYAFMPEVLVYPAEGGYIMLVAGTSASVRRVR